VLDLGEPERLEHGRDVVAEPSPEALLEADQPPTGLSSERPQVSTVPAAAGFCSSALPSGIQSRWSTSMAWRSSMQLRW
jgi:hypothetical protein